MTDHGRAHLLRRIASFTRGADLARWWSDNASDQAKADPDVMTAKYNAERRLK